MKSYMTPAKWSTDSLERSKQNRDDTKRTAVNFTIRALVLNNFAAAAAAAEYEQRECRPQKTDIERQ